MLLWQPDGQLLSKWPNRKGCVLQPTMIFHHACMLLVHLIYTVLAQIIYHSSIIQMYGAGVRPCSTGTHRQGVPEIQLKAGGRVLLCADNGKGIVFHSDP